MLRPCARFIMPGTSIRTVRSATGVRPWSLGPNINAPMNPNAVVPALAAIAKAKAITAAGDKEKALIGALAARYSDDPKADRLALDANYADAMVKVAGQYPEDVEIAVLAAEALMDTQPWDYWTTSETGAKVPKGRQEEINKLLERALKANPDHPGAIHFYIHLWEASDTPERAVPHADRLAALMPGAGHLVHMPSHVHYKIGRFIDSMKGNQAAAAADEAFLAKVKDLGAYRNGYYPAQCSLRSGVRADGRRCQDDARCGRQACLGRNRGRCGDALPGCSPSCWRPIGRTHNTARPTRSWRWPTPVTPFRSSKACGTMRAA